jgi:hypothetical protein
MALENLYWPFSSAAQSISAFVALLLAGFALVHITMDAEQQKDQTLDDIHLQLKRQYYKQLRVIAILTAIAVLSSLAMVYLNPYIFPGKSLLMIATSLIDGAAIVTGIFFVIIIIDPDKYRKTAERIIQKDEQELGIRGTNKVSDSDFFRKFIDLESEIRDFFETHKLQQRVRDFVTPFSFRDMVTSLYHNEIIDQELLDNLFQINKYRNLVFHGHIKKVDQEMIDKLDNVSGKIKVFLKRYRR